MDRYSKVEDILDRSDDITEVMTQIPHWIVRGGMTYLFFCIVSLLGIGWFIRYPDVINSKLILTSSNPPARIVAQANGKLQHIFFKENDQVETGALLGVIENPANSSEVLDLLNSLRSTHFSTLLTKQTLNLPDESNLGELQKEYAAFNRAYQELKLFNQIDPVAKEISATRQELKEHINLLEKQAKEKEFYKTEVNLVKKDYDRNAFLYKNKVIADKQIEDNERELLGVKRSFEQLESNIASTKIKLVQLQKALVLLVIQNQEKRNQYELSFTESYKNLLSALSNWEQKYLLKSPISGKVTYLKYWSNNQYVTTGDEVMVIVPHTAQTIIGKIALPIQNSGKVKVGQKVNIYLKNYPYQEFGTILGLVKSISLVPKDNLYVIEIILPSGLKTSYHKKLDFKQEMQGSAEIITEELRLLERIFYQFRVLRQNI
ncbi:HlyD family secretion protein [Adhaeribacter radiodurans]|uniref:HlyD family efflux transporter periplasmic adaptor subunit n=1 Tax=Adhaeribacter radiodurans TaxID=2745197 RepID=A0A7L7L6P9_9BACT|nr:HlyD family efflux transporter periplasmic adaptor subunit [Adhaeribacter radiodurans]QMU28195.1 HlyD family efflux transporter periplasmic adaptor subunit [Adhaeribacter radiodurans]